MRVVIYGKPGSGKTTALAVCKEALKKNGYKVTHTAEKEHELQIER